MIYFGKCDDTTDFYQDDDGSFVWRGENTSMRLTNEDLYIIDKYGNEMSMTDINASFRFNSPTYEELYEHWLKTKQND